MWGWFRWHVLSLSLCVTVHDTDRSQKKNPQPAHKQLRAEGNSQELRAHSTMTVINTVSSAKDKLRRIKNLLQSDQWPKDSKRLQQIRVLLDKSVAQLDANLLELNQQHARYGQFVATLRADVKRDMINVPPAHSLQKRVAILPTDRAQIKVTLFAFRSSTTRVTLSRGTSFTTHVTLSRGTSCTTCVTLFRGTYCTTRVTISRGTSFTTGKKNQKKRRTAGPSKKTGKKGRKKKEIKPKKVRARKDAVAYKKKLKKKEEPLP